MVKHHLILISLVSCFYKGWPRSVTSGVVLFRSDELHWIEFLWDQIWAQLLSFSPCSPLALEYEGTGGVRALSAVGALPSYLPAGLQIPSGKPHPNQLDWLSFWKTSWAVWMCCKVLQGSAQLTTPRVDYLEIARNGHLCQEHFTCRHHWAQTPLVSHWNLLCRVQWHFSAQILCCSSAQKSFVFPSLLMP